jgi:diguanylate cyclase (GGDEF)-like protein
MTAMPTLDQTDSTIKLQIQQYLDPAEPRPWLLRFPPLLEQLFDEHVQSLLVDTRPRAALIGSLLIGLFAIGDWTMKPASLHRSLFFRIVLLWPCTALLLWLVRRPSLRSSLDALYTIFGVIAVACCIFAFPGYDVPSSLVTQVSVALLMSVVTLAVRPKMEWGFVGVALMLCGECLLLHNSTWLSNPQRLTSLAQQCTVGVFSLMALHKFNLNRRIAYLLRLQAQMHSAEVTQLNQLLVTLSRQDPLTGLANRRYFNERLDAAWQQALREASSLSVAIIDVDHFKALNDSFGHDVGDRVLERLARALECNTRHGFDLAARLGGEEFAMLYPGLTEAQALHLTDRLRHSIAEIRLPIEGIPKHLSFTVSCGIASAIPSAGDTTSDLFRCADQALYRAKRSGRNRVCV